MIGSFCFVIAPFFTIDNIIGIPENIINYTYFIGSIFFTSAAYLQYLQAINADITNKNHIEGNPHPWIWFKLKTRNLGILSSFVQFIGTLLFNLDTYSGTLKIINPYTQNFIITTPDMLGSVLFLSSSILAWFEVYKDSAMKTFRSILWWIIWLNIIGSIFFQISAISALFLNLQTMQLISVYCTMFGGIAFFTASYLLVPESKNLN